MKSEIIKMRLKIKHFLRDRVLPRGLLARTVLMIILPVIILQLVVAVLFYEQHWQIISRRMANSITGDIAYVISLMRESPSLERQFIFDMARQKMGINFFLAPSSSFPPSFEQNDNKIMMEELQSSLKNLDYNFAILEGSQKKTVNIYMQLPEGVLGVTVPTKRFFSSTAYVFPAWMFASALLLFGVSLLFMRIQIRTIRRLSKAADSFGKGYDAPNFKPEGSNEVRQAAIAFIAMRDRIKRQLDERTAMLAGVSHDLRTPLTRMKLQLAMMKKNSDIELLRDDVKEMETMLEGYLAFAKGEGKELFKMVEVTEIVKDLANKIGRNSVNIDLHIEQPQKMMLRPNDFARAISNILSNAARYASRALVNIGIRNNALEIVIDDNGKGIPKKSREDVFKAFYRLDSSRNPQTGGVGLGLTITKDIVIAHGGEIFLEDSPAGGLRVRMRFPL